MLELGCGSAGVVSGLPAEAAGSPDTWKRHSAVNHKIFNYSTCENLYSKYILLPSKFLLRLELFILLTPDKTSVSVKLQAYVGT